MPRALVRAPTISLAREATLTYRSREAVDAALLMEQHREYRDALRRGGFAVLELPQLPNHPDATFVEDLGAAVPGLFVWGRSGEPARAPEARETRRQLAASGLDLVLGTRVGPEGPARSIVAPGTLEGGDVLAVDRTVLVGESVRTSREGARQLAAILTPAGYAVRSIPVSGALHLKTACTALDTETLLVNPAWVEPEELGSLRILEVAPEEPFGGNVLPLPAGTLLVTASSPRTRARIERAGFDTIEVDISEFEKAEGGLSCLSLRIP